jgi:hypothetical protein
MSEEHIIPDSLLCPPDLILKHEVCESCNQAISRLDNSVIERYDLQRWMVGIPNKKGKTPQIVSIRNLRVDDKGFEGEKRIVINNTNEEISADGLSVPSFKKNTSSIKCRHSISDDMVHVKMSQEFRTDRNFIRGIYKIGFEMLCHLKGSTLLFGHYYDEYRDFIFKNRGNRELVYYSDADSLIECALKSTLEFDGNQTIVVFRLLNVTYFPSFTKDESFYDSILQEIRENPKSRMKHVRTIGKKVEYY